MLIRTRCCGGALRPFELLMKRVALALMLPVRKFLQPVFTEKANPAFRPSRACGCADLLLQHNQNHMRYGLILRCEFAAVPAWPRDIRTCHARLRLVELTRSTNTASVYLLSSCAAWGAGKTASGSRLRR